ncbi:MAG TPA: sigma-70 family RNA polymerase sigma factor [Caulobacterales bacterium]|jgi:RNA polymerase sigma-70 factor (ECF subfamily)|nr:sigma-70 family RNA polymerase sigma factor [Caulobacterales bacterium]
MADSGAVMSEANSRAFKQEMTALLPQVRAFARFLCRGDRAAADDLAQDALMRAWAARASFQPGSQMRAWLFVIVRNVFYSDRRKAWRSVALDQEAAERTLKAEGGQPGVMDLDDVRRSLNLLPEDQREALVLVTAGGLSYEEAAEVCGCAVGTIKSRVNRARKALLDIVDSGAAPPRDTPADDALERLVEDARRLAADR